MLKTGFIKEGKYLRIDIEADYNEPGFLNRFAATLFALDWNVFQADLITTEKNHVRDVFYVDQAQPSANWQEKINEVNVIINSVFEEHVNSEEILQRYGKAPVFSYRSEKSLLDTEVIYEHSHSTGGTRYYIETSDRKGLLYGISSVFTRFDVDIKKAKIRTNYLAGRAEDTFLVTTRDGKEITNLPLAEEIRTAILEKLKGSTEKE